MTIRNTGHRQSTQRISLAHCLFIAMLLFLFTMGCSSQAANNKTPRRIVTTEQHLREAAREWLNTPYRMGGQDRGSIDCSGLVFVLYRELFNRQLPRTTKLLVQQGERVDRDALKAGDLIFFQPPNKVRHVGVYLGGGEFLHATTRRGVIVSHLSESYWHHSYWTARRLLQT